MAPYPGKGALFGLLTGVGWRRELASRTFESHLVCVSEYERSCTANQSDDWRWPVPVPVPVSAGRWEVIRQSVNLNLVRLRWTVSIHMVMIDG